MSKSKKKPVVAARDSFPSPEDVFTPGTMLDNRFRIIARLSRGPRGQVYVAEHTILEERLAIRVLHDTSGLGSDLEDRFLEEAKTLARLNHKNIVKLFDAGVTANGYLYATMELIEGLSFDKWRSHESDPDFDTPEDARFVDALLIYMRQVADGVLECHENGIFHHNLKPSNIYLTETERSNAFVRIPKLIDFGRIKKRIEGDSRQRDEAYRAPEMRKGEVCGARADIFSIGVIFYEMLTGDLPHQDVNGTNESAIDSQVIRPSKKNPYVPKKIEQLIMRAISWRSEDRFASMYDFVEAFDAALVLHKTRVTTDVEISPGIVVPDKNSHFFRFALISLALVVAATVVVGGIMLERLGDEAESTVVSADTPNADVPPPAQAEKVPEMPAEQPAVVVDAVDAGSENDGGEVAVGLDEKNTEKVIPSPSQVDDFTAEETIPADVYAARKERAKKSRKEMRRLINDANKAMDMREWEKAGALFRAAIGANPQLAVTWAGLSRASFQMKKYDDAVLQMNKALAIRNKAGWRLLLGEYYDRGGNTPKAAEIWNEIIHNPLAKNKTKEAAKRALKQAGVI